MTSPLTLESLIGWLEIQPADGRYRSDDCCDCLLARWIKSIDADGRPTGHHVWRYDVHGTSIDLSRFIDIAIEHPHDFGAALERARELQAMGEVT